MDLEALMRCLGTGSCVVTQLTSGMIIGMLLFLIASGVTLIFGVLNVINFAHGSLYMLGAYIALTLYQATVCYAVVLISDDLVTIIWGPRVLSMGMPVEFRLPPLRFLGGVVPPFYLFMIGAAIAIGLVLWLVIAGTRFGKVVRAAAVNGPMVSALGIRVNLYYAAVFGIGSALAGAAGALAAPVRSLTPGMGFSILIESGVISDGPGRGSWPCCWCRCSAPRRPSATSSCSRWPTGCSPCPSTC